MFSLSLPLTRLSWYPSNCSNSQCFTFLSLKSQLLSSLPRVSVSCWLASIRSALLALIVTVVRKVYPLVTFCLYIIYSLFTGINISNIYTLYSINMLSAMGQICIIVTFCNINSIRRSYVYSCSLLGSDVIRSHVCSFIASASKYTW